VNEEGFRLYKTFAQAVLSRFKPTAEAVGLQQRFRREVTFDDDGLG
jgi:hypothetical protein